MGERYTKVFALPNPLYATGSSVAVIAGALLKDNKTPKIVAQLKFLNLQEKNIKAVTVYLSDFKDIAGNHLEGEQIYQYLDLSVTRDEFFGQKVPIVLSNPSIRSFSAKVTEVIYEDNSSLELKNSFWEAFPVTLSAKQILKKEELISLYFSQYGQDALYLFHREKDLWQCVCGEWNGKEEQFCYKCHRCIEELETFTLQKLERDLEDKKSKEKVKAIEKKEKADKEKAEHIQEVKKLKKTAFVVIPIVALVVIIAILGLNRIENQKRYKEAVAMAEQKEYGNAIAAFEKLDNYKDSEEKLLDAKYNLACDLVENKKFSKAIEIYTELGDYKDSLEQIKIFNNEALYYDAIGEYLSGNTIFTESQLQGFLDKLKDIPVSYKDAKKYIDELTIILEEIKSHKGSYYSNVSGDKFTIEGDVCSWNDSKDKSWLYWGIKDGTVSFASFSSTPDIIFSENNIMYIWNEPFTKK